MQRAPQTCVQDALCYVLIFGLSRGDITAVQSEPEPEVPAGETPRFFPQGY